MEAPLPPTAQGPSAAPSRGFWAETWLRFRKRKIALVALIYVILLAAVGFFAPFLIGTKPIVCKYKGRIYFPAIGYYVPAWEDRYTVFKDDRFRRVYPVNLKKNDPDSWAIWPLIYQDPIRKVRAWEWRQKPRRRGKQAADKTIKPLIPKNPAHGPPNEYNLLGTNLNGYDVLAILIHGARTALLVGFVSMGIASVIGITCGAFAGYLGGWVDLLFSRIIEIVMCIPSLVLILSLLALVEKPTIWHMMAVLGLTRWTDIARLTRGEFLKLRESDFVMAARALGIGRLRIMFWHVLRNALAPILVPITFGIATAILTESALSFLGFGAPPPTPSWGALLADGRTNHENWWLILFPGAAIFLTVLAYNLVGEGLQEATDPRLRDADV